MRGLVGGHYVSVRVCQSKKEHILKVFTLIKESVMMTMKQRKYCVCGFGDTNESENERNFRRLL